MFYAATVKAENKLYGEESWKEAVRSSVATYIEENPGAFVYMVSCGEEGYDFAISEKTKIFAEGDLLSFMSRSGILGRISEIKEISFPSFLLLLKEAKENRLLDESETKTSYFLETDLELFKHTLAFPSYLERKAPKEKDILPCHLALSDLDFPVNKNKHYFVSGSPINVENYTTHIIQTLNKCNVRDDHYPFLYKMADVNAVTGVPGQCNFQWFSSIRENGIIILDFTKVVIEDFSGKKLDDIVETISIYARNSTVIVKTFYMGKDFAPHFLENKFGLFFDVVDEDRKYNEDEAYSIIRTYAERTGERELLKESVYAFMGEDTVEIEDILDVIEGRKRIVVEGECGLSDYDDHIEGERIYTEEEVEASCRERANADMDTLSIVRTWDDDEFSSGMEALDNLIGLEEIKKNVRLIVNHALYEEERKKRGIRTNVMSRHMAFLGNPGTSKTTVARYLARIYKEMGILENGYLVEVGRCDLVGKYMGETATKVKEVFNKAKGSLLFIDEAYSLLDNKENEYGDEALATIVQEMENHRDDTVVVFAGYPGKMGEFLERNPGLWSRVPFVFDFPSYSLPQLWKIFKSLSERNGFVLSEGVKERVLEITEEAMKDKNFGNGRYMRNLLEKAELNLSGRIMEALAERSVSDDEMVTLTENDFADLKNNSLALPKKRAPIGFSL